MESRFRVEPFFRYLSLQLIIICFTPGVEADVPISDPEKQALKCFGESRSILDILFHGMNLMRSDRHPDFTLLHQHEIRNLASEIGDMGLFGKVVLAISNSVIIVKQFIWFKIVVGQLLGA
jgi:hypothetical protein